MMITKEQNWMAKQNVEVGAMFADVTGSTKLHEAPDDEAAESIIGKFLAIRGTITEDDQGFVIKTIGDEIMCRFTTANDCERVAIECEEEISAGIQDEKIDVSIKVGFHFGPAILMEMCLALPSMFQPEWPGLRKARRSL